MSAPAPAADDAFAPASPAADNIPVSAPAPAPADDALAP